MKYAIITALTLFFLSNLSCTRTVICTEEFRMIGITVTGGELTDYYTVRKSNSDTIRHTELFTPDNNWYSVLTDNYHGSMAKSQETFRFIGLINLNVVVDEKYVISADKCHIQKVSGAEQVAI